MIKFFFKHILVKLLFISALISWFRLIYDCKMGFLSFNLISHPTHVNINCWLSASNANLYLTEFPYSWWMDSFVKKFKFWTRFFHLDSCVAISHINESKYMFGINCHSLSTLSKFQNNRQLFIVSKFEFLPYVTNQAFSIKI